LPLSLSKIPEILFCKFSNIIKKQKKPVRETRGLTKSVVFITKKDNFLKL
jgi:hypothetical protein